MNANELADELDTLVSRGGSNFYHGCATMLRQQDYEIQDLAEWKRSLMEVICLTKAEIESGLSRVKWAELLIKQLPEEHEGRNSWLLNYGSEK
jgi:hypothetical protein